MLLHPRRSLDNGGEMLEERRAMTSTTHRPFGLEEIHHLGYFDRHVFLAGHGSGEFFEIVGDGFQAHAHGYGIGKGSGCRK